MPKYLWTDTKHGRRYGRVYVDATPAEPAAPKLDTLKKDELVALATERGLDTEGTKAELLERLNG